jgi:hypothetical protein
MPAAVRHIDGQVDREEGGHSIAFLLIIRLNQEAASVVGSTPHGFHKYELGAGKGGEINLVKALPNLDNI